MDHIVERTRSIHTTKLRPKNQENREYDGGDNEDWDQGRNDARQRIRALTTIASITRLSRLAENKAERERVKHTCLAWRMCSMMGTVRIECKEDRQEQLRKFKVSCVVCFV